MFYVLCYFGESVTTTSGVLDATVYSKSWYLCPVDTQRYFSIFMMLAQKPLFIEGFARLNCTRETFKQVIFELYSFRLIFV